MISRDFLCAVGLQPISNVAFIPESEMAQTEDLGALLSALLNCGGGAMIFGAQPQENAAQIEVVGLEKSIEDIHAFEKSLQTTFLPGAPVFVQQITLEEKRVLIVDVPPGKDPPYASGNIIYALHDGSPEPASNEEIRGWVLASSGDTNRWENRPAFVQAMDAIERPALERAVREAVASKRKILDVQASTEQLLSGFQVLRDERLLNAGLVLFGRNVGRWLPQAHVRFVHFAGKTSDTNIVFSDLYDGPICDTINTLREYIVSHAPQVQIFDRATGNRHQEIAYPVMPVREALVNAFAHRDYESALSGIMVRMFSDRVEIANSGKLPEGVTAGSLNAGKGAPSRLVNPLIANNLYFRGYMEHVGRGIAMIKNDCQAVGTKVTWSTDTPGMVKVTLVAHTASPFNADAINPALNGNNGGAINVANLQEKVLSDDKIRSLYVLLTKHPCASSPKLQELTGMTRGAVQGLLDQMKAANLVFHLGSKKTGGYYAVRQDEINANYKAIVQRCFEAEHTPEHRALIPNPTDQIRQLISQMRTDGLIRCDVDALLGFTEKGRELFFQHLHLLSTPSQGTTS